jgi:hypothetical protein
MKHQLYRHFDREGVLLYVGESIDTLRRLLQHSRTAHWYYKIVRVEIQHFDSRKEALIAERKAIRLEKPLHNVVRYLFDEIESLPQQPSPSIKEAMSSETRRALDNVFWGRATSKDRLLAKKYYEVS